MALGFAPFAEKLASTVFPWTDAAIDLDFVNQRYWWGGAEKTTGDFTTYNLNGATFDANGLNPVSGMDVSLSLSGLGTFIPGAWAFAGVNTSAPGTNRAWWNLDDGTSGERISIQQTSTAVWQGIVMDGGVQQSGSNPGGVTTTLGVRHGQAASYETNNYLLVTNGTGSPQNPDTTCTMPTVTRLALGRNIGASTFPTGALSRLLFFQATKTVAELTNLSRAMRDLT